jgi:hypothetical protein
MPEIVRARSGEYRMVMWSVAPGRSELSSTRKPSM